MNAQTRRTPCRRRALDSLRRQRGVTLIIAMIMLVVIGIMSVAIMRHSTNADQVTTNTRLQTQANQAAQMALLYCESQINLGSGADPEPITPAPTEPAWADKKNWVTPGVGHAHTLAREEVSGGAANFPAVPPQCISEASKAGPGLYTVTARGFSPDYREDSTSHTTISGSVIWLQSTVYAP